MEERVSPAWTEYFAGVDLVEPVETVCTGVASAAPRERRRSSATRLWSRSISLLLGTTSPQNIHLRPGLDRKDAQAERKDWECSEGVHDGAREFQN